MLIVSDLASSVEAIKGKRQLKREAEALAKDAKRQAMRDAMPEVAGVVDELRAAFGSGVAVLSASENGKTVRAERQLRNLGISEVV